MLTRTVLIACSDKRLSWMQNICHSNHFAAFILRRWCRPVMKFHDFSMIFTWKMKFHDFSIPGIFICIFQGFPWWYFQSVGTLLYKLIDTWFLDSNRRVGVRLLPWRWHILSIPLTTGRGTSSETCGLDDVFPPDDLGSRPEALCCVFGLPIVSCSLALGIWCSTIPHLPGCFLSLDLLWEYRIQHGVNGPLYVTSSYSSWIFCRGVSGFATDCPCGVWCRGLITCLLHVGPPFGNRILNNSRAVGLT